MRLPFSIDNYYSTHLSKSQVTEQLNSLTLQKELDTGQTDNFDVTVSEHSFMVQRTTNSPDRNGGEKHPAIEGFYFSERPLVINIVIKPSYFLILFFSIFVFTFIPVSIFIDEMTINGVLRAPTILERLLLTQRSPWN